MMVTQFDRLGTNVSGVTKIEDAIRVAHMDWNVRLDNAYRIRPGATFPLNETDLINLPAKASVREDNEMTLGVVGDSYKPLQNIKAWEFFQEFLDSGEASLATAGVLGGGKRVWVLAHISRPDETITNAKDDRVCKYLLLSNGHTGFSSVKVGFTPIRVICANTLAMAIRSEESRLLKVKHTKSLEVNLNVIRGTIDTINQSFTATAEQYRKLAKATGVDQASFLKYVKQVFSIDEEVKDEDLHGKTQSKIGQLYEIFTQDVTYSDASLWTSYNAVTAYLTHRIGRSDENRLASMLNGPNEAVSKRALSLALDMAG